MQFITRLNGHRDSGQSNCTHKPNARSFSQTFPVALSSPNQNRRKNMRETDVNIMFSKATVRMPMRNIIHNGRKYYLIWTKLAQRAFRPQISKDTLQQRSSVQ